MPLSFLLLPSFDTYVFPVLPVVANVNAEPVFIIIMNLFNLFLLGLYFSENKSQELRYTLLLALICGLGLATKINFLIILFSALLLVPLRQKILFIIISALSFFFFTIPIFSRYPQLFQWITDMVGHSSRYGTGSAGFIDEKLFFYYLKIMISVDGFFIFSALGLWIFSSINLIRNHRNRESRFLWILSFCCLLHIAATAKHFSFHYLLPGLALFNSMFFLFYLHFKNQIKLLKPLTMTFIVVFAGISILYTIPYYKKLHVLTKDISHFNAIIEQNYPACNIIPATTGDIDFFLNKQEALQRANGSAFRLEGQDLFNLYPDSYYFFSEEVTDPNPQVESYGIWNYQQRVYGEDIKNANSCVIFTKYTSDFSSYPYQVNQVAQSKYLSAYLLIDSTEKQANELFLQAMDALKKENYQQALALGIKSKQLNYEPSGQLGYILTIIYHDLLKSRGLE